jgi:pimeloyl-ACP methyl ester carboxylesterase
VKDHQIASDPVVLVPGLWMNRITMIPLGRRLRSCGFQPVVFSYRTVRDEIGRQAQQLLEFIGRLRAESLHLVGHSLGGRVITEALLQQRDPRVRRIVLLGSPLSGSVAGRAFGRTRLGRLMIGRSGPVWETSSPPRAARGLEIGIVAGALPIGLGRFFADIPRPHDGVVSLGETRMDGCADAICLRINHMGMIYSSQVAHQVCCFLRNGRFEHY